MNSATDQQFRTRIRFANRSNLEDLRRRSMRVLERVQADTKYRLRSKVEEVEVGVAIDTLALVEAALKRRGRWFIAKRRLLLKMKHLPQAHAATCVHRS
jgi:hypothetical protein